MPIRFDCACGQGLTARDEHAGLRVRCHACGNAVAVPRDAVMEEPSDPGMIRFSCDECSKTVQARSIHAGKQVRCPDCSHVLTVPGSQREATSIQTSRPKPWTRQDEDRRGEDTEDRDERNEDREEDRPRRRGRKKARGGFPWVWVGVGMSLLVAGFAAWFFFLRSSVDLSAFDLVPRDAQGFFTLRPADVLKTELGKKAWEAINQKGAGELKQIQEKSGLTPHDLERVTGVFTDVERQVGWFIVNTSKPYDKSKVLAALDNPQEKTHENRPYHFSVKQDMGVFFVNDRQMVWGQEEGLRRCLGLPAKPKAGPLDEAIAASAKNSRHMALAFNMDFLRTVVSRQMGAPLPPEVNEVKSVYFGATIGDQLVLDLGVDYTSRSRAKQEEAQTRAALTNAKNSLPALKMLLQGQRDQLGGVSPDVIIKYVEKLIATAKVDKDGTLVTISASLDTRELVTLLEGAVDAVRGAADAAVVQNNFKQISLAMVDHADQNRNLMPTRAILHPQTRQPLLSWRVTILPYLDQQELYQQIHLNEPWDSPHNRQFWSKMPKTYELPGLPAEQGMTAIQVFAGQKTAFTDRPFRYPANFMDGASQTILIAEAANPVNWMKPEDIDLDRAGWNNLRATLGDRTGKGPLVAMGDGSCRHVGKQVSNQTLEAAITPDANDILGDDWENQIPDNPRKNRPIRDFRK
jgi:DNA-directed RNA polymerase subunit RPC12/RpoP